MAVGEQVAEVIRQHRGAQAWRGQAVVVEALESVGLPRAAQLAQRYPHQLSGGERQRIAIAIALCLGPDLLILDEPTTNLDATTEAGILDLLESRKAGGQMAMIYISHNLGVIARIADRVAVMYGGEVVETGAVRPLFRAPMHPYTAALLACLPRPGLSKRQTTLQPGPAATAPPPEEGCRFRHRCRSADATCTASPGWSGTADVQEVRCWHRLTCADADAESGPATTVMPGTRPALEVAGLNKGYAGPSSSFFVSRLLSAVTNADLVVPEGAIVGLVGESGSGKSTLLRCIAGLETPESGRITFAGMEIPKSLAKRPHSMRSDIQMIFQDPESTLNPKLTIAQNLAYHLRALRPLDDAAVSAAIDRGLAQVQLDLRYRDRLPGALSGGEKQRVAIARAFLAEPKLVLCDEPLSALDVSVQSAVCQLLLDLQAERRTSYLFVSHDLSIVRYLSDHIVVMYLGEIVEDGEAASFDHAPLHPYSEALFSATPPPDPDALRTRITLSGQVSSVDKTTPGCIFNARCPRHKGPVCNDTKPDWKIVAGRRYRCHWPPGELALIQERA